MNQEESWTEKGKRTLSFYWILKDFANMICIFLAITELNVSAYVFEHEKYCMPLLSITKEGFISCNTYYDIGPQLLRSYPKKRSFYAPLIICKNCTRLQTGWLLYEQIYEMTCVLNNKLLLQIMHDISNFYTQVYYLKHWHA